MKMGHGDITSAQRTSQAGSEKCLFVAYEHTV